MDLENSSGQAMMPRWSLEAWSFVFFKVTGNQPTLPKTNILQNKQK